ncbi:hypothetical protein HaLaN_17386, partial [Haematococcus lacustris]
MSWLQRAV